MQRMNHPLRGNPKGSPLGKIGEAAAISIYQNTLGWSGKYGECNLASVGPNPHRIGITIKNQGDFRGSLSISSVGLKKIQDRLEMI
jgi:hypothetical protein